MFVGSQPGLVELQFVEVLLVVMAMNRLVAPGHLQQVGRSANYHSSATAFSTMTSAPLQRPSELHLRLLVAPFRPHVGLAGQVGGVVVAALAPPLLLQDAPLVLPPAPPQLLPSPTLRSNFQVSISIQSLHAIALPFFGRVVASDDLLHSPHLCVTMLVNRYMVF